MLSSCRLNHTLHYGRYAEAFLVVLRRIGQRGITIETGMTISARRTEWISIACASGFNTLGIDRAQLLNQFDDATQLAGERRQLFG